jgi:hypothetical protein
MVMVSIFSRRPFTHNWLQPEIDNLIRFTRVRHPGEDKYFSKIALTFIGAGLMNFNKR